jgi:hypothetical protein
MKNPHCEVFINFMISSINRWAPDPNKASALNDYFGTSEWVDLVGIEDADEKITSYANLYERQLKTVANIKYIRRFMMVNRFNQPIYFLFFGTNDKSGLRAMKSAMWSVDLTGGHAFSDRTDPRQSVLFEPEPNLYLLRNAILSRFTGTIVKTEEVEDFVLTETPYRPDKHLKKPILDALEDEGLIEVAKINRGEKRRKHSYNKCIIKFV